MSNGRRRDVVIVIVVVGRLASGMGTRTGLVLRYIVLSGWSRINRALRIVMDGSSIDPSR